MDEDRPDDDAGADADAAMLEAQAAMLRLLEQRMQDQFGQAFSSGSKSGQATDGSEVLVEAGDNAEESTQETTIEATSSYFRLFNAPKTLSGEQNDDAADLPRIRLQSPTDLVLLNGRSLNRILAVEDEPKSVAKDRRRQIKSAAVDAAWIIETSGASHWAPRSQPPRKLLHKTLHAHSRVRKPLPPVAILYAPAPKPSRSSLKIRANVEEKGRIKVKAYPDLGKQRIAERIARMVKRRAAMLRNNTAPAKKDAQDRTVAIQTSSKPRRVKRKSKKRRMHERETKAG